MERTLTDKLLGRWETPIPKRHRFVSARGEPSHYWRDAVPSFVSFLIAKTLRYYRPGTPWLPYSAIRWLDNAVLPTMRVLEIGAGASTVFFAKRARSVVSVERDPVWRSRVRDYGATVTDTVPDGTFDLILLDDEPREAIFEDLFNRVNTFGYLVVDNWDWPRYDNLRQRYRPNHVFTDFAPYQFSVSSCAAFYKGR
jgi:hypothetical protein